MQHRQHDDNNIEVLESQNTNVHNDTSSCHPKAWHVMADNDRNLILMGFVSFIWEFLFVIIYSSGFNTLSDCQIGAWPQILLLFILILVSQGYNFHIQCEALCRTNSILVSGPDKIGGQIENILFSLPASSLYALRCRKSVKLLTSDKLIFFSVFSPPQCLATLLFLVLRLSREPNCLKDNLPLNVNHFNPSLILSFRLATFSEGIIGGKPFLDFLFDARFLPRLPLWTLLMSS